MGSIVIEAGIPIQEMDCIGREIQKDLSPIVSPKVLSGRKQKSSPNVAQTGLIRRKYVRIPVEPINK
jgi:hypothetical protein